LIKLLFVEENEEEVSWTETEADDAEDVLQESSLGFLERLSRVEQIRGSCCMVQ